ncbi:restriction endonuclease subunit S [Cupriavidus sp. D39]|uniref:restriction endonuclease subunit S n=1 Tax=Cupriavidus sp. D39 TaxID=2997877 RepID=UPI00226EB0DB|nr:restriction endonuclease subunit S [Cupriavidus sp. D39]MCY0853221.1 restriction endonuclease subunit S [Cupriavidus sp. D39]
MKAAWHTIRLGDIADIQSGGTPLVSNKAFWNGEIPWYSSGELNDLFTRASERSLSVAGLEGSNAKLFPAGSLLIGMYDTAALKMSILDRAGAFNQAIAGVRPNDKTDLAFIRYAIDSNRDQILDQRRGVRQKNLSLAKIRDLELQLPPLHEQQRIVAILDETFDGIAIARANAAQNLINARALFEGHLDAVFSQRGEGWREATIGQHIRFIDYRGKTPQKTESGVRLITAKNVKMGFLQEAPMEFVAPESYDDWMTRGIPNRGDVLFTTEAPLANVAQLDTDEKVVFAQRIIIMQPDASTLDSTFLKYLLLSPPVQKQIHDKGTGATVKGIKASLLKAIEVSFPSSVNEQQQLAEKLDELAAATESLESLYQRKIEASDELKESMLHQAFSGQL